MKLLVAIGAAAAVILATTDQPAWEPLETSPSTPTTVVDALPGHQEADRAPDVTEPEDGEAVSYVPEDIPTEVVESLVSDLTSQLVAENPDAAVDYVAVSFDGPRSATVAWAWTTPDVGQLRLGGVRWVRADDGRWDIYLKEPTSLNNSSFWHGVITVHPCDGGITPHHAEHHMQRVPSGYYAGATRLPDDVWRGGRGSSGGTTILPSPRASTPPRRPPCVSDKRSISPEGAVLPADATWVASSCLTVGFADDTDDSHRGGSAW